MKFTMDVKKFIMTTHRLKKSGEFEKVSGDPTIISEDDVTFDSIWDAKHWKRTHPTFELDGQVMETDPESSNLVDPYIDIRSHRITKPKQNVFTREQLKKVLVEGNDDIHNSLVIDEEGYIQLVPFDQAKGGGYPVRFETFHAGNGYVGSKSALNHLENTYITLLEGWAEHFISGGDSVYKDVSTGQTEEELLKEIEEEIQKLQ